MRELNRRELLLKGTSAAAAAAAATYGLRGPASTLLEDTARASSVAQTTPPWNHDPSSPIGPSHWGEIDPGFASCAQGMRQSPVDIRTSRVREVHGPPLQLRYEASELAVENTGHVVEVPIPAGVEDVLQIGGDRYTLTQYHFHALSEHTVNGRHADVEGTLRPHERRGRHGRRRRVVQRRGQVEPTARHHPPRGAGSLGGGGRAHRRSQPGSLVPWPARTRA